MRAINVTAERDEVRRLRARVTRLEEALGWLAYARGERCFVGGEYEKVYHRPRTMALCRTILQEGKKA